MDCVNVQRDVIEGELPRDMPNDIISISLTAPFSSMQSIFGRNPFTSHLQSRCLLLLVSHVV